MKISRKKIEKIVTLCCALWLVLMAMISGVMAFESMNENEFAADRNHRIGVRLHRQHTNESGAFVDMSENPVLYPLATGYTENVICVENIGNIDTYNRVLIAVPSKLDETLELIKGEHWKLSKTLTEQDCGGELCNIYIFTMNGALTAGTVSEPALLGVRLDAAVQQQGGGYVLDGVSYDFGDGLRLKVYAQAVQTAFLQSPEYAFRTASMSENPWADSVASKQPVTVDAVKAVLQQLPNGSDITGSVTDVVFGRKDAYAGIMESCYGRPVDKADPNGPWAFYQASTDVQGNTTWTVYVLADDLGELPDYDAVDHWIEQVFVENVSTGRKYASLSEAVADIPKGAGEQMLRLLGDITVRGQIIGHSYAQQLTIDLNGFTMSGPDKTLTVYRSGTVVTLKNGTVSGNSTGGTIQVTYGGKLILGDDLVVKAGGQATAIKLDNGTVLTDGRNISVPSGKNSFVVNTEVTNRIELSAGTYKTEIKPEWCAEGYVPVLNADGSYTVAAETTEMN